MGKDNLTSLLNEMLRAPATRAHYFYDRLDEAGLIAYDYGSYMVTEAILLFSFPDHPFNILGLLFPHVDMYFTPMLVQ